MIDFEDTEVITEWTRIEQNANFVAIDLSAEFDLDIKSKLFTHLSFAAICSLLIQNEIYLDQPSLVITRDQLVGINRH